MHVISVVIRVKRIGIAIVSDKRRLSHPIHVYLWYVRRRRRKMGHVVLLRFLPYIVIVVKILEGFIRKRCGNVHTH